MVDIGDDVKSDENGSDVKSDKHQSSILELQKPIDRVVEVDVAKDIAEPLCSGIRSLCKEFNNLGLSIILCNNEVGGTRVSVQLHGFLLDVSRASLRIEALLKLLNATVSK